MIKSYQNSVIKDSASLSLAEMVGNLAAIIIINHERMERYPEEARAFFVAIFGEIGGELAFHNFFTYVRRHKEEMFGLDI